MSYIVDGSNLLGSRRADASAKRALVRALAQFARARRTKVICTFDGVEPEHFGSHLGSVTVLFSGARPADELIETRAASGTGWKVVTADRALGARIRGRRVEIVDAASFMRELESAATTEAGAADEDWVAYFSDPKNRNVF